MGPAMTWCSAHLQHPGIAAAGPWASGGRREGPRPNMLEDRGRMPACWAIDDHSSRGQDHSDGRNSSPIPSSRPSSHGRLCGAAATHGPGSQRAAPTGPHATSGWLVDTDRLHLQELWAQSPSARATTMHEESFFRPTPSGRRCFLDRRSPTVPLMSLEMGNDASAPQKGASQRAE